MPVPEGYIGLTDKEFETLLDEGYFSASKSNSSSSNEALFEGIVTSDPAPPTKTPSVSIPGADQYPTTIGTGRVEERQFVPPETPAPPTGSFNYARLNASGGFGSAGRANVLPTTAPTTNIPQNNPVENAQAPLSHSNRVTNITPGTSPVDSPQPVSNTPGPRGPVGTKSNTGTAVTEPAYIPSPPNTALVETYDPDGRWSGFTKGTTKPKNPNVAPKPTGPIITNYMMAEAASSPLYGNLDHLRPRPHWRTGEMEIPYYAWTNRYGHNLPGKIREYIPTSRNNIPPGTKPGDNPEIDDRYKAPLSVRVQRGEVSTLLGYPLMKPDSNDSLPSYITQSAIAGAWNAAVLTGGAAQDLVGGVVGLPFDLLGLTGNPKSTIKDPQPIQPIPPVPRRPLNFADDDL